MGSMCRQVENTLYFHVGNNPVMFIKVVNFVGENLLQLGLVEYPTTHKSTKGFLHIFTDYLEDKN